MICSIRFFELTVMLGAEDFNEQLDRAYKRAERKDYRMYTTDFGHIDESLTKRGIGIAYYDNPKKKKIKIIVFYPSLIIDDDNPDELWKPTSGNVSRMIDKLDRIILKYFDSEYGLGDFDLTRMDFAVDLNVGRERVFDYIKVMHNIGRVKCFSPMKYGRHDGETKDRCFGLIGNSNGIEFHAHGLEYDKKILRTEVRLTTKAAIREYSGENDTYEQIRVLAVKSEDIFVDTLHHIIPRGDFYKKPKAEKLIRERVSDWKIRTRMIRMLTLVKERKSLHLAIKEMNCRNYQEVLAAFAEIDVSPVTISKRHDMKMLENIYKFM